MAEVTSRGPALDVCRRPTANVSRLGGFAVAASSGRYKEVFGLSLEAVWVLLRVRVLSWDGHISLLVAVVPAHNGDALPYQKNGYPAKSKSDHSEDSNAILNRTPFAVLDVEETHSRMRMWCVL